MSTMQEKMRAANKLIVSETDMPHMLAIAEFFKEAAAKIDAMESENTALRAECEAWRADCWTPTEQSRRKIIAARADVDRLGALKGGGA